MDIFIHPTLYPYFQKYPLTLVDVGASGGLQNHWEKAKIFLRRIAFEPDVQEFERLINSGDANTTYLNTALYKEKGDKDFYITDKQEVSSLLRPNESFLSVFPDFSRFNIVSTMRLKIDTLDNQLASVGVDDVDFIKIDTQGSELSILEGARAALVNIFGLEIEVEFSPIYEGQPLFSEVESFLRTLGFQLFDLAPCYWKREQGMRYGKQNGQLIFADALFLRDVRIFGELLGNIENQEQRKAKLLKALAVCFLYGYVDYATELFESQADIFDSEEVRIFRLFLGRSIPWSMRVPNIIGRNKIARMFAWLSCVLEYHGWAIKEKHLGNQ